ncbi:UNVERIFIED_CONTAM: hypothetical protein Sangu_2594700 [Sesamum angustifolium]|uniref:MULE transposase domain-containing protein n=1 Tax=Sesamum angustifolium TaxID=2727405 RepID=A0AAW2J862_9LAMI
MRSNPRSTVVLKLTDNDEVQPTFSRLYVCFEACKQGFKNCRRAIGVDGYFLKGPQGGHLLTAVGVDPNAMYPIAYAIVENENKDSWVWFLSLLQSDLELDEEYAWTFMSDKQKAARATRIEEFKARMEQLKELDEDAYNWLVSLVDTLYQLFGAEMKFRKTMFMMFIRCYEHAIQGVNGAELWPKWHNARTCNKRSGQAEDMPIGTSQPPSTQESNHTQSTSLEPFNAQSASSQPATTVPRRKKLPVRKAGSKNMGLKLVGKSNNIFIS